ncbi:hypothetical protein F4604DRAFT_1778589 [Suillus subluteus]|nr:hypothetical protein F4604DRAFT_1778589 [Suillus subluteus]
MSMTILVVGVSGTMSLIDVIWVYASVLAQMNARGKDIEVLSGEQRKELVLQVGRRQAHLAYFDQLYHVKQKKKREGVVQPQIAKCVRSARMPVHHHHLGRRKRVPNGV